MTNVVHNMAGDEAGDVVAARDKTMIERASGALYGLAIGDALGMPTQLLSRATVEMLFPVLDGFAPGPPENDVSRGQPAGRVTDDTEQALIVADLLLEGEGQVDGHALIARLRTWAEALPADGGEQLGPSTRRALGAAAAGLSLDETGRWGDTNGAAMRIAPVGVAVAPEPLETLVERVAAVCRPTHNTGVAIAGAAAVAAAVSVGVAGGALDEAIAVGAAAARLGRTFGHYVAGADVAERLVWAVDLVRYLDDDDALDAVSHLIGTGMATQEAVPAAFALAARWPGDPWRVCLTAARLGGDSDTVGAMAGALAGACVGSSAFPSTARETVSRVNELDLERLAVRLTRLRITADGG